MHGQSIANDYKAKLYTLANSIRYGRTDAALVRIITPVFPSEDRASARERALQFARQIVPLLPGHFMSPIEHAIDVRSRKYRCHPAPAR